MTVCTVIFMPFIDLWWYKQFFFLDFSYTPDLTLVIVNQHHQLTKMVFQMVSVHVSRLLCCWHSLHILKILSIIRQNMAAPVQPAGKLNNWTKLYQQLYIFNTCAATMTFMTEYVVAGLRWMCSYAICTCMIM